MFFPFFNFFKTHREFLAQICHLRTSKKIDIVFCTIQSLPGQLQTSVPHLRTSKQIQFQLNEFANFFLLSKMVKS